MSMRMQVAEVGTYKITLYKNNDGQWDFWIKQEGHTLVKSTGGIARKRGCWFKSTYTIS
jgi:hypothetical protein